jgi:hypothetical protein
MMWSKLLRGWNQFFFAPQSPLPICIFRILYSLCVLATLLLIHGEWLDWYGPHAWVSEATMQTIETGPRLNLFAWMPQSNAWAIGFFWAFLAVTLLLLVGLWTRFASIAVFICLASMQQRNLYILHSGDTFLRVAGFFLMFTPAGAMLSIDRWRETARWRKTRNQLPMPSVAPRAPWAQRMIQFELALVYFCGFLWKLKGHAWIDGTALYYVTHLTEIQRFPVPAWVQHPAILKLGAWYTLALEFSLGVLVWFRPFRYPLLALGVLFHLTLEYCFNIPMFEWDILAAYVLFIDPADLARFALRSTSRDLAT